jgi:aryl-alcohol dehydrogenase-like predicted oxidoreductase
MQYRTLGRTGLQVSLVGFGTGGPSNFGQRTGLDFAAQRALLRRCLELGINLFDTAAAYRESEELLGRALEGVQRERYILATKCTLHANGRDGELVPAVDLQRQCEQSLRRLHADCIDVYQLHGVLPDRYDEVVEKLYPMLQRLRDQGKVRFLGVSELFFSDPAHEMLARAVPSGLWDTVMLKYGILNQYAAREVLPLCQEYDVGVLNMAPVRVKLTRPEELRALMAGWTGRGLIPAGALPEDDPLGWLVGGTTDSAIAAGYKFAAAHPAISTVLTGTSSVEHLEANVAAVLGPPLPDQHMRRLQELFGDLAEGA